MRMQRKPEPDQLHVELVDRLGNRVELVNDGISTELGAGSGRKSLLQTRTAFRGFVGGLTGLLGYEIDVAYGTWTDENGYGHYEEEGGEA